MREALLMATGIAVSPISIVAVVLILTTPRARTNGPLFLVGWVLGLAVIVLLVAAFAGDRTSGGARWVGVVDLVAAALLLLVAVRTVLRRQRAGTPVSAPRWTEVLDRAPPHATLGMGMAVVAVNPKNFLLAVGGSLAIADADVAGRARALVYVAFLAIGTMGVAVPLVLYLAAGARALTALLRLRNWLDRYNSPVTLVVCLLVAAVFARDAVVQLDGR
jgi:threonine/homoserine/homoserine lactone efflux protein